MSSVPSEKPSRREWRFTWESLAHIPTLRLYLFHPDVDPSARCSNLSASLRLDQFIILVSWVDDKSSTQIILSVPVPRVLIDPSCPVDCRAMGDHIEIKLTLVLPLDHPAAADLYGVLASESRDFAGDGVRFSQRLCPLSLDTDRKSLSSDGVNFYCKACAAKLTKRPLRHFVEMPSENWQEVADNWFGACCCSFGGASEKIVGQYVKKHDFSTDICHFDGASMIICQDDLEGYMFQGPLAIYSEHQTNTQICDDSTTCSVKVCNGSIEYVEGKTDSNGATDCYSSEAGRICMDIAIESPYNKGTDISSFQICSSADLCNNKAEEMESGLKGASNLVQPSLDEILSSKDANFMKLNIDYCCGSSEKPLPKLSQGNEASSALQGRWKWVQNSSVGGGFIIGASKISHDIKWVEFLCKNCSACLGCYPCSKNASIPLDGGIRLFKCCISTCTPVGGPCDIFRNHTLQRVFVHLLLESAEDELSYRIIVRDLKSKSPMLLLVLLSSKSWISSGYSLENFSVGSQCRSDLQPVLKVLFSDCSTVSEENSSTRRIVEDWSTKNHTEEVYMMAHLIEELLLNLKSAMHKLPPAWSSMQGMSLSSLER